MNSGSEDLPSVLSGASKPSTIHLSSYCTTPTQQDKYLFQRTSASSVCDQGYVYSLSGRVKEQDGLDQNSYNNHKEISSGPYHTVTFRRSRKSKKQRLLPYQKCHQAQFLCLEQDAELLMQMLQEQIKQGKRSM
ncbi:MAG: hypothetical protein AAGD25_09910 [Cyanobacteria bacterium P01_F01_bin.150]